MKTSPRRKGSPLGWMPGLRTWSISALIVLMLGVGARAGGVEPFEPVDAKALIKACWDNNGERLDIGTTPEMRESANKSLLCMENIIVDQAQVMFDAKTLKELNVPEKIVQLRTGVHAVYWAIYNSHKECAALCGNHRSAFHLQVYRKLLVRIINSMAKERNLTKL